MLAFKHWNIYFLRQPVQGLYLMSSWNKNDIDKTSFISFCKSFFSFEIYRERKTPVFFYLITKIEQLSYAPDATTKMNFLSTNFYELFTGVFFLSKCFDNIYDFRIQIVLKIENNPFIFKIHPQRLLTNLKNSVFNLK